MKESEKGYYDLFVKTCGKFPRDIGVRHYADFSYKTYTYSELYGICEYIAQLLYILEIKKGIIGVVSDRNPLVPCVIAAIHKHSPTFVFLEAERVDLTLINELNLMGIVAITEDNNMRYKLNLQSDLQVKLFNFDIRFYKLEQTPSTSTICDDHSYIMYTSGSTGEPKHIKVPIQCLEPNISDITNMFKITKEDVIYFSTPLTFDPSMVEILLALSNGASLLIAPEIVDILFSCCDLQSHGVTFWQTTPSKFFRFSDNDIARVLSETSTLKVLALGGEPITNIKRLKQLKSEKNATKIYCMYGVTEMSCWATIAEVKLEKIEDETEVPLGDCLSETRLELTQIKQNVGKIMLGSSIRKSNAIKESTFNDSVFKWIDTGDVGEIKNGTVYFRGRIDDTVKRFGQKINLHNIEKIARLYPDVTSACCVWLPTPHILVLYYTSDLVKTESYSKYITQMLPKTHHPDKIVRIDDMPINEHGKISKKKLLAKFHSGQSIERIIQSFIKSILNIIGINKDYEKIKKSSFIDIGGDSMKALSLTNQLSQLEPSLSTPLMSMLLSPTRSVDSIVQQVRKDIEASDNDSIKRLVNKRKLVSIKKKVEKKKVETVEYLAENWSYNTGKCVDSTPTVYQSTKYRRVYVTVGSHSGTIVVMKAFTGKMIGEIDLNARIIASIVCFDDKEKNPCGFVGAYDGSILCYYLDNAAIKWCSKTKNIVKSKGAFHNDVLYIANYNGNVVTFNSETGVRQSVINIDDHAISANLLISKKFNYLLSGSLGGMLVCIDLENNQAKWSHRSQSPIFSSPVLYNNEKFVLYAEVKGVLYARNISNGDLMWTFSNATNHIFSSFTFKTRKANEMQFFFGCHDNFLYSITVTDNKVAKLKWKINLDSPIYATPVLINNFKFLICAASKGEISIVNTETSRCAYQKVTKGELFSTPLVYDDFVFIGSRDDCLHCYRNKFGSNIEIKRRKTNDIKH